MKITDIQIVKREDHKVRAFVTLTIDGWLRVSGVKIIRGRKGLFMAMPSRRKPDGTRQSIVHPLDQASRIALEAAIMAAYRVDPPEVSGIPARLPTIPPSVEGAATRDLPASPADRESHS